MQKDIAELLFSLEKAQKPSKNRSISTQIIANFPKIPSESVEKPVKSDLESAIRKLSERILSLESNLTASELSHQSDLEKHTEKCAVFERHITSLEIHRKKIENDNERLKFENKQLKSDVKPVFSPEEKREKEMFELELMVKYAQEERFAVEQKFAELKMDWTKEIIVKEEMTEKIRKNEEELREIRKKHAEMEVEFLKVNEQLGQVLNQQNDLELENQRLKAAISARNSPSKRIL